MVTCRLVLTLPGLEALGCRHGISGKLQGGSLPYHSLNPTRLNEASSAHRRWSLQTSSLLGT